MKTRYLLLLLLPAFGATLLQGCLKDKCSSTRTYVRLDPVYKTPDECRFDLKIEAAQPLHDPGKIYAWDHYLFINEREEGIHVFDNSDASNPVQLAFWRIKGNVDIAVYGHYLYADQYMDLLSIDISDLQHPQQVCRRQNEFSLFGFDPYKGYIIDYTQTEITEEVPCDAGSQNWLLEGDAVLFDAGFFKSNYMANSTSPTSSNISALAQAGIAGSYSRFALYNDYLYTIDQQNLRSYSLSNPACPDQLSVVQAGWNIESIFPWKNKLFLGAQTGVFIFNNSNPTQPQLEANFWHANGCDPVVCDDKNAYITIHDGTTCGGSLNELDIVGIQYLPETSLLATLPMKHPMGLGFNGQYLYLCDDGLKVFDKSDPLHLQQVGGISGIDTYDVIVLDNNRLLLVGASGFFQYDISDPTDPKQLSSIGIQ